jgi:MSHA biogenesis protein MshI
VFSFLRPKHTSNLCSIEINADGLALASKSGLTSSKLKVCDFYPYNGNFKLKDLVNNGVTTNNLQNSDCIWVLHPDYYRTLLINAPNVPPTEYNAAIPWQIKDMITYPVNDVAIDYFVFENQDINLKKLYVVVSQKSFLENIVHTIKECQLNPIAIDIREFAIRNLTNTITKNNNKSYWCLHIDDSYCLLLIIKQGKILFIRRLSYGWKSLKANDAITQLSNEVQRSMNYCNTELKIEHPEAFIFTPCTQQQKIVFENLATNLAKQKYYITPNAITVNNYPISDDLIIRCWPAIGGIIRNEGN